MLGHLLLHRRGITSVTQGGIFDFLTPFRLGHHLDGVVHIAFECVYQVGVLFQFPVPIIHQLQAFVGQSCRQSQLQHLDTRSQFHDQPFLLHGIFRGCHTIFHYHALTSQPLLVAGGTHNLPQGFLYIVVVMFEIPLSRHIDRIPVAFIVRHTTAVRTDGHEIIPHLQQEVVETDV